MKKEQESLIDIFSEDRDRRDKEEQDLRNKLQVPSSSLSPFVLMFLSDSGNENFFFFCVVAAGGVR